MKIKRLTPTPDLMKLYNLATGEVFRFPQSNSPCMKLPYDGDSFYGMYKHLGQSSSAIIKSISNDIDVYDENFYYWIEENDDLDQEWIAETLDEFQAYINLEFNTIHLSHKNEAVVPMTATVIVEDMRSPD
jgi:hypothetical protein